jgi:hypothetical protein
MKYPEKEIHRNKNQTGGYQGLGWRGNAGCLLKGHGVLFWGDGMFWN